MNVSALKPEDLFTHLGRRGAVVDRVSSGVRVYLSEPCELVTLPGETEVQPLAREERNFSFFAHSRSRRHMRYAQKQAGAEVVTHVLHRAKVTRVMEG